MLYVPTITTDNMLIILLYGTWEIREMIILYYYTGNKWILIIIININLPQQYVNINNNI